MRQRVYLHSFMVYEFRECIYFFDAVDQIQRTLINYYGINSGNKILKSNRFSIVDQQTQSIRNLLTGMLKGLIKHTF